MSGAVNERPLVSVIMPAYNSAGSLERSVGSVKAQTVSDWELLIVDDCSSDGTYDAALALSKGDPRVLVFSTERNSGPAAARNIALENACGRYAAFLDSDDIWHPEKLARQLEKMRAADAAIGYCSYRIIGADGSPVRADYLVPETASFEDILKENYIQCSAMLIRADIVKRFRFNTEFFHEDYILGLDMLGAGERAVGCRELLLDWRYLENSRSFNKKKSAVNRWRIYREYLHLSLPKTVYLFVNYTAAGLRKYLRKSKKE